MHDTLFDIRQLMATPATIDEIETQFALLSAGLKMQKTTDNINIAAAYLIAMEGFSGWVIRRSIRDILKGQAEGFSKTFMPSSAQLAAYCTSLEQKADDYACYIERLLKFEEKTA